MVEVMAGNQELAGMMNTTLGFINNMDEPEHRELALLRLLYLEISENLGVLETVPRNDESGRVCEDTVYESVAEGLSFLVHQAVVSTRLLHNENLPSLKMHDSPFYVSRLEPLTEGAPVRIQERMQVVQALELVCVEMSVLRRRAKMTISPEVTTDLRYGPRLKNIRSYEQALAEKILESEFVWPSEAV